MKTEIKNIDDQSTDEELTASSITNNPSVQHKEDGGEDYLFLGSWFDDQINGESNSQNTVSGTTGLLSSNTNAMIESNTLPTLEINDRVSSGLLSNANSSNATQILDATFELDQSTHQTLGSVYLVLELLDFIVRLLDKEPSGLALVNSIQSKQVEEFSMMLKYLESTGK